MNAALDTDVLVAALRSPTGASRELIRRWGTGEFFAVASVGMFLEYEAVLKRPEHLTAARLTEEEIDIFLNGLAKMIQPVTPYFLWRPQLRDPNDEMILEAAVNGRAERIITFNRKHFLPAAQRFGIQVLLPAEFLRSLQ
jgi:putative PIN family toxin of toxin-antitoxin system